MKPINKYFYQYVLSSKCVCRTVERNSGPVGKLGPAAAVLGQELPQRPTPLQRHHRQSRENFALLVHWLRGLRRAVQVVGRANDVKLIDISRYGIRMTPHALIARHSHVSANVFTRIRRIHYFESIYDTMNSV
ncbi:uncharacterized protein LOC100572310 [Acyrthosiphon pisum]|uniref:Uncharacterized protein n=1 Tax=Acyrthosiphon pisum TaxID=7029 RepID=A0A8R2H9F2_ACYPI|nr:uncharacterized protein LOC100572310 [Acyrthosiphon pisum]|eukprot:XP_016661988.1 PREDICTED: uncharacterized protein LOC100572310 [Acyrthosiphon pisum]